MSGHSHWAKVKHQKGAVDAKRGQLFTKLGREIAVAAREGGGDPEMNFRLRLAVDKARIAGMPKENIERAILRGQGKLKGEAAVEQIVYEGYGPHGTAIIVEALTDNRNRAVGEVRSAFTRHGGSLGENGSVSWMFERQGYIEIEPKGGGSEDIALIAIDAGAADVRIQDDSIEVYTAPEDLERVKNALEENKIEFETAELSWVPKTMLELNPKATIQNMKLIEALENLDDVQEVFSNLQIDDAALAAYEAEAA